VFVTTIDYCYGGSKTWRVWWRQIYFVFSLEVAHSCLPSHNLKIGCLRVGWTLDICMSMRFSANITYSLKTNIC